MPCPFGIDVFAVLHIEPAVIVSGIVGAMLAGAPVMSCQFQIISLLPAKMFRGRGGAAKPQILRKSASGNTQYELTPVSYTHLDVYKRQAYYLGGKKILKCDLVEALRTDYMG